MARRDVAAFVDAGRTLYSLGLVKGSEGNLSTFDGVALRITRTGCELAAISPADVLDGTLDEPPARASSDVAIHVATYREFGAGAVAHAHPVGSVPAGWTEGQEHGVRTFAPTLSEAVQRLVDLAKNAAS